MTAINMPTAPGFTTCRFGLETNTQTFTSPLTKSTQRVLLGIAKDYDRMAETFEQIDRTNLSLRRAKSSGQ